MKRSFFLLLVLLLVPGLANASTTNHPYYGTTSQTELFLKADGTSNDDFWIDLTVEGGQGQIIWYSYGDEISRTATPVQAGKAPSNANSLKLRSVGGKEVYAVVGHTTNPASETVYFSGSNGSTPPTEPDPLPEGADCDVCKCIEELKTVGSQINNSVNSNGEKLSNVVSGVNQLNQTAIKTNNTLDSILGELKTSVSPSLPPMPEPTLNDNKPNMPTQAFEDKSSHFSDRGDTDPSAQPKPLPTAPEPEKWKDENGDEMDSEDEMSKDGELSRDQQNRRDSELSRDAELNREEFTSDKELVRDDFTQDSQLQQDSVLEIDNQLDRDSQMTRSDQYEKDKENTRDNEYTQSPDMNRDNFYEQAPIDRTPPDWTSN